MTTYPGSLDSFTNPLSTDTLATAGGSTAIPHANQHANLNDAVLAIQTKLNTSGNHSTAGVVFLDTNKKLVSTPQGNAGQFLMSYGPIANGGPEWISLPIVEIVSAATTTTLTGTWVYANNIPGTTPATLTYTGSSYTIDGYSFTAGDRVLIKDQTSSSTPTYVANGVYVITNIGTSILLTRDNDSDTMGKIGGTIVSVENGNANGGTLWQSTNSSSNTLGTTPILYNNIVTSTGGSGIAGQLLMSYGGYGLNAPEWVSIASMESASVATTTALAGTYANNNPGTTPSTLTITATGVLTIDGYTTQLNDRILVKDQLVGSTPTYIANGVYVVTTAGATGVSAVLTRDNDSDTMGKLSAMPISIDQGATNGGLAWFNTNKITDTMGTTPVSYSKFLFSNSPTITTPTLTSPLYSAGTITAAPIRFTTSGSLLLTTPAAGNMEVDSSGNLYYSPSTTRYTVPLSTTGNSLIFTTSGATTLTLPTTGTLITGSSPTITTPTIDTVNTSLTTTGTAALWNTGITTGTISIGGSLTTGTISIATGGTGVTNINLGHTNALIGLTGNTTVTGTLTATSTVDASSGVTSFFPTPTSITLGAAATTATLFGAATTLSLGNTATTAQTVNMFTASTGASTYNIATGATTSATTKAVNIGGGGVSGSVTNITLGSTTSGAIGTTRITGSLALATPPAIITTTTYTVGVNDTYLIFNTTAACTVTMPSAATYSGRVITLKQIAAFAVSSSSSTGNLGVVPLTTTTAGTAILSGAGKFAHLVSDGTNWVTMMSN